MFELNDSNSGLRGRECPWTISPVFTAKENVHRYSQNQVEDTMDYSERQLWLLWPKFCLQYEYVFQVQVQGILLDRPPKSHGIGARLLLAMSKASAPEHLPGLALLRQVMVKAKDKIHPALSHSLSMQVAHLNKGRVWSVRKQKLNMGLQLQLHFRPPLPAQARAREGDDATSASLKQPHWWQRCMDLKANTGASPEKCFLQDTSN